MPGELGQKRRKAPNNILLAKRYDLPLRVSQHAQCLDQKVHLDLRLAQHKLSKSSNRKAVERNRRKGVTGIYVIAVDRQADRITSQSESDHLARSIDGLAADANDTGLHDIKEFGLFALRENQHLRIGIDLENANSAKCPFLSRIEQVGIPRMRTNSCCREVRAENNTHRFKCVPSWSRGKISLNLIPSAKKILIYVRDAFPECD